MPIILRLTCKFCERITYPNSCSAVMMNIGQRIRNDPRGHSHGSIKNNVRYNLITSFKKNKTIVEVKEMITLFFSTMLQPDIWKGKSLQRNLQIRHGSDQELPSTLFRRGNLINPVQSPPFSCCCSSAKQEAWAETQHVYMKRIIQLLSEQLFFFEKRFKRY